MATTQLITPQRAASPPHAWRDERPHTPAAASALPTVGEEADETLPLVGAVPIYGPPIIVLAAPWLLLSLMLAGPFAVLVTLVVALVAVAVLVGLIGAILATPYLLVRHVRRYRAPHAPMHTPVPPLVVGVSR
jgi:hypothetical protein